MKNIGGFFELEISKGKEYYPNAIKLNTCRNSLEYILRAKQYDKINLPKYCCDSLLEPIDKLNINYEFYEITTNLEPIINKLPKENEVFLLINYFGLKNNYIKDLTRRNINFIVDNSQAFYSNPIFGIDTIYSPRKFFGVPDGGYLFTDQKLNQQIEQDLSYNKIYPHVKRIDLDSEEAYSDFRKKENKLKGQRIQRMSNLTRKLLSSIDYEMIKEKRDENFNFLHQNLSEHNELTSLINNSYINGPMIYPFLIKNEGLKNHLIENKIFVATYWDDVLKRTNKDDYEKYLSKYLISLPIDQRYNFNHMKRIVRKVRLII